MLKPLDYPTQQTTEWNIIPKNNEPYPTNTSLLKNGTRCITENPELEGGLSAEQQHDQKSVISITENPDAPDLKNEEMCENKFFESLQSEVDQLKL